MGYIINLINLYWKFDNDQSPTSSWHDKNDLIKLLESPTEMEVTVETGYDEIIGIFYQCPESECLYDFVHQSDSFCSNCGTPISFNKITENNECDPLSHDADVMMSGKCGNCDGTEMIEE